MWKLPDGRTISNPKDVEIDDVRYSSQIFRRWSKEELNAVGIFPFRETGFNRVWFKSTGSTDTTVDGEIVREHTIGEKYTLNVAASMQLDKIKSGYIAKKINATNNIDFYDAVGDSDTKKIWSDYLTALKNAAKDLKDMVVDASVYAELINLNFEWPVNVE